MKLIDQIMLLPDDEKLLLVNQILESVVEEKHKYSVPDDLVQLVAERVAHYKLNPESGLNLEQFKTQVRQHLHNKK